MGTSEQRRVARLIDELIDRAHGRCPDHQFTLQLPTGEDVLVPRHDPVTHCAALGHSGYFLTLIAPLLGVWPTDGVRRGDQLCSILALPVWESTSAGGGPTRPTLVLRAHQCAPLTTDLGSPRRRPPRLPWSRHPPQ